MAFRPAPTFDHAARLCRAAWLSFVALVGGCQARVVVGAYTDAGARCDPLGAACGDGGGACTIRADPSLDACRAAGASFVGAPCTALDACLAGSQCASISGSTASLDPMRLVAGGTCVRVCARDAPRCAPAERCIGIETGSGGVRVDYGVCAP